MTLRRERKLAATPFACGSLGCGIFGPGDAAVSIAGRVYVDGLGERDAEVSLLIYDDYAGPYRYASAFTDESGEFSLEVRVDEADCEKLSLDVRPSTETRPLPPAPPEIECGYRGNLDFYFRRLTAGVPASMDLLDGGHQRGFSGQELPQAVVVELRDIFGDPVHDVRFSWRISHGGGSVRTNEAFTDAEGRSSATWILGVGQTRNGLVAEADGLTQAVDATGHDPLLAVGGGTSRHAALRPSETSTATARSCSGWPTATPRWTGIVPPKVTSSSWRPVPTTTAR